MPLVINSLGSRHTHTNTYTDDPHRINFKKSGALACVPGLKTSLLFTYPTIENTFHTQRKQKQGNITQLMIVKDNRML